MSISYLYWSDWGDIPHIGRIGMDGSNRSVIVDDKITWPNGLTLDFVNDRIYWADAREDYIEFASLDGTNRHTGECPGGIRCGERLYMALLDKMLCLTFQQVS